MTEYPTPSDDEIAEAFGVDDVDDVTDEMVEEALSDHEDPPDRIDVSGYDTAAGAAKKTAEALREWAEYMGHNPDDVLVWSPDETEERRGDVAGRAWCVAWEGGPHEWASALCGGESMTAFAGPRVSYGTTPEVDGLLDGDGFHVECYYSFDLLFYNQ